MGKGLLDAPLIKRFKKSKRAMRVSHAAWDPGGRLKVPEVPVFFNAETAVLTIVTFCKEPKLIFRKNGPHVCRTILLGFAQTMIYPFSKICAMIFYPIFYNFDPYYVPAFSWGGSHNKTHVCIFVYMCKIHYLGATSLCILSSFCPIPTQPK